MSAKLRLIPFQPVGDFVLLYIYDDGYETLDLGNGKQLVIGLEDTDFLTRGHGVDSKHPGIRGRWALVVADNKHANKLGVQTGDKVFCDELRWSRGVLVGAAGQRIWKIPPTDILAIDRDGLTEEEEQKVTDWLAGIWAQWPEAIERMQSKED